MTASASTGVSVRRMAVVAAAIRVSSRSVTHSRTSDVRASRSGRRTSPTHAGSAATWKALPGQPSTHVVQVAGTGKASVTSAEGTNSRNTTSAMAATSTRSIRACSRPEGKASTRYTSMISPSQFETRPTL